MYSHALRYSHAITNIFSHTDIIHMCTHIYPKKTGGSFRANAIPSTGSSSISDSYYIQKYESPNDQTRKNIRGYLD